MFKLQNALAEELPKFFEFTPESLSTIVEWAKSIFESFAPLLLLLVGLLVGVMIITFILRALRGG